MGGPIGGTLTMATPRGASQTALLIPGLDGFVMKFVRSALRGLLSLRGCMVWILVLAAAWLRSAVDDMVARHLICAPQLLGLATNGWECS